MKIEPLEIRGKPFAEHRPELNMMPFRVRSGALAIAMSRDEFAALVRWGAAALARTHPDRVAADPATCDHRHQHGNAEATVCAKCGTVIRNTGEGEE